METRKVRKSGNSYIVTLPPSIMEKLNLQVGDELAFSQEESNINLSKKERSSIDDDFLKMVEGIYNEHEETFKKLADR